MKKNLSPKKIIEEFDRRALERKGIVKVLSDRFGIKTNEEFDDVCNVLIRRYFPDKMGNIVDIGTGIGRLARYFSRICNKFVGIDFSNKILSVADEYLKDQKNIILINNDVINMDFLPEYFDLGIASLILKHNSTKRAIKIIENLKKWCKKVLLIEHVAGGAHGSNIAIIRKEEWYIKQFKPMKPVIIEKFQRHKDRIIFCVFE